MAHMAPSQIRRVNASPASTVNLNFTRPGMSYTVITANGTRFEVRRDFNPTDPGPADPAKAHVYLTTDGGEELAEYTQAIITVGNPWHISKDHTTDKVVSIELH